MPGGGIKFGLNWQFRIYDWGINCWNMNSVQTAASKAAEPTYMILLHHSFLSSDRVPKEVMKMKEVMKQQCRIVNRLALALVL